jgi:hypothetical protein
MAGELVDAEFVDGHCTVCHLDRLAIERLDMQFMAGKAEPMAVNSRCGHTMVYRSLGLWTSAIAPTLCWIIEKTTPPPDPLEAEHRRLIAASDSI